MTPQLHPAENRGLRELYLSTRQLIDHWSALATRRPDSEIAPVLTRGAQAGRDLIKELRPATESYGLYGQPAAQGGGRALARQRDAVRDRFLELNQAARFAVEDLQHVVTLLGYLEAVSGASGNGDLAEFAGRWERKLRRLENETRRTVAQLGTDPDSAIEPLDSSKVGKVAHGAGNLLGTVGEWVDGKAARRGGS